MKKINIAELLRNCPKGMEMDCTMFDDVKFSHIQNDEAYPIVVTILDTDKEVLTAYGTWNDKPNAKCVIFPKGKTTWEGFVPPCKFKDGDIVSTMNGMWIGIVKKPVNRAYETYITINGESLMYDNPIFCFERFATEKEKARLFKAIKDNGYKWNEETKTLEKLIEPKFKVGDKVRHKDDKTVITITGIKDNYYLIQFYNSNKNDYQNEKVSFKDQDKYELVPDELVPEFKNGDVIVCENHWGPFISIFKENVTERNGFIGHCVFDVDDNEFKVKDSASYFNKVRFATKREKEQLFRAIKNNGYKWNTDNKTLEKSTPNKFDINTLVPFESKVLVRDNVKEKWHPGIWGFYDDNSYNSYPYKLIGDISLYCIPYEGNEHLLGTTNDCDEYFKSWKS